MLNNIEVYEPRDTVASIIRPYVSKGTHPVETGRYLIPTTMIYNVYKQIKKWIEIRSPGAIFYGRPRIGKTKAIEYICKILPYEFGTSLPTFHICSVESNSISEDNFFSHLLEQVGHTQYQSGKAYVKRDRLIKYLIQKGELSDQKRIILFIDDAQRFQPRHYEWLMDIYNQVDRYGISMTVILVGQEELMYQKSSFINSKKLQIVGRFMVHEYRFTGAEDVEDIRNCLIGYDEGSEFPIGSGWSFTRYFFPEAFEAGYRLENCAEDIYKIFLDLRQDSRIKNKDIPMIYLALSIEYVLKVFGANGANEPWITNAHWKEAIEYSGYVQSEKSQQT